MTPIAGTANAAATSPRTIIDGILVDDDTLVLQRRALRPAAELNTLPRFGDDRWSLNAAIADRHTPEQSVNWPRYPAPLRHACKLYAFALINVVDDAPRLINAHTDVPGVKTVFADLGYLHKFVTWLDRRGISEFAALTQQDLDAYYSHVTGMPGATSKWRRKAFLTVQRLHAYRTVLPEFCRLPAGPLWGGASAASLAGDPIARLRENAARRIQPDVMQVLLSAALLVSDTVAADLLPITRRLIAMRTIAHDVARLGSRPARQGVEKTRAMQDHLERLLPAYAAAGHTLPAQVSAAGEPVLDHIGFATAGWFDRQFLRKSAPARQAIAASGLPMTPNLLRVTTFADVKSRPWRGDPVDAETLRDLLRHVTTACFLVIAYLSGVRTGEALNLQRGCITRDPKLGLIFMSGQQMKATGDRRERSVRTVPWVVTEQTARAVSCWKPSLRATALSRRADFLPAMARCRRNLKPATRSPQRRHRRVHRLVQHRPRPGHRPPAHS
jgi:hypothetical protein